MKLAFVLVMISVTCAFAKQNPEFMEFGLADDDSRLSGNRSNFQLQLAASYIHYEHSFSFDGAVQDIESRDEPLGGVSLDLGYQMSLYGALTMTFKARGFYYTKNDKSSQRGDDGVEVNQVISQYNRKYKVYGYGPGVSLNYEILGWDLLWQPFVEFGAGIGSATFDIDYERFFTGETEFYRAKFKDSFGYGYTGAGINLIAKNGIFSYIRADYYKFMNIKRKGSGTDKNNDADTEDAVSLTTAETQSFGQLAYSLGMGYTF